MDLVITHILIGQNRWKCGDDMSMEELASVGVFVIASIAYLFWTAVFGLFISSPDIEEFTIPAWLIGAVVYGITFVLMYKGWIMVNVKNLFGKKLDRLIEESDIYCKDENLKIHCPVCGKELKEDKLDGVEYVKTKRRSEIFIHTKCVRN